MDKRSEIREGIDELIGEFMSEMGCEFTCIKAETKALDMKDRLTDSILNYLASQGVVIEVEREFPFMFGTVESYLRGFQKMREAGYIATEPLIKE